MELSDNNSESSDQGMPVDNNWRFLSDVPDDDGVFFCCGRGMPNASGGYSLSSMCGNAIEHDNRQHWCVVCNTWCCLQCVRVNAVKSRRFTEGLPLELNVLCNYHEDADLEKWGYEVPPPILPSTAPPSTKWIDLALDRKGKDAEKGELEEAPVGSSIPCVCKHEVDNEGLGNVLRSHEKEGWWRCILHKDAENVWHVFNETMSEKIQTVVWETGDKYNPECLAVYWGESFVNPTECDIESAIDDGVKQLDLKKSAQNNTNSKKKAPKQQGDRRSVQSYYEEAAANTTAGDHSVSSVSVSSNEQEQSPAKKKSRGRNAATKKKKKKKKKKGASKPSHLRDNRLHHNHAATNAAQQRQAGDVSSDEYSSDEDASGATTITSQIEFLDTLGNAMVAKLNNNYVQGNPLTYQPAQFRSMLTNLLNMKHVLLNAAGKISSRIDNKTYEEILNGVLSFTLPKKIGKLDMASHLMKIWSALRLMVGQGANQIRIPRAHEADFRLFSSAMSQIESACQTEIAVSTVESGIGKSLKLSHQEMARPYLEDAKELNLDFYKLGCACCNHWLVDDPNTNNKIVKSNRKERTRWENESKQIQKYKETGNRPLKDGNGQIRTSAKAPTVTHEVIVCHCGQNMTPVGSRDGCRYKCFYDNMQYDHGKCPVCVCRCRFVGFKNVQ